MSNATDTTTRTSVYGFPVERVFRESYTPTDDGHGRIRFYTVTLEGVTINRKTYDMLDVEYVIAWGAPRVLVSGYRWSDVTDSARAKVEKAAEAHMQATYAARFGDDEDRRGALEVILMDAARNDFHADKRRGALTYAGRHGVNAYPFTNRRHHWEALEKAAGATLTDAEVTGIVKRARAESFREHIAELTEALEALER